ncbi:hypothetical protein EDB19DRAFT_2024198, partial [Suillus lakei]
MTRAQESEKHAISSSPASMTCVAENNDKFLASNPRGKDTRDSMNLIQNKVDDHTGGVCFFWDTAALASFSMGYQSMMRDLNCTQFQATVGLSMWSIRFSTVPLITSSFTEEFRSPEYIRHLVIWNHAHGDDDCPTVILGRLLGGAFGSTGATLVGATFSGVVNPLAFFTLVSVAATGLGPVIAGVIEVNPPPWMEMDT